MGHILFLLLHLAAVVFFMAALWVTIPLHIIYLAVTAAHPPADAPDKDELRKCPFCAEQIRKEAVKCKHCGSAIEAPPKRQASAGAYSAGKALGEMFKR